MNDSEDYRIQATWPSGRVGITWAEDIETAEAFQDFALSAGAEAVHIDEPKGVLDCE